MLHGTYCIFTYITWWFLWGECWEIFHTWSIWIWDCLLTVNLMGITFNAQSIPWSSEIRTIDKGPHFIVYRILWNSACNLGTSKALWEQSHGFCLGEDLLFIDIGWYFPTCSMCGICANICPKTPSPVGKFSTHGVYMSIWYWYKGYLANTYKVLLGGPPGKWN